MSATDHDSLEGIAIVGMAGRFPGAKNITEFWQNLCNDVESISHFRDEELIATGISPALINHPNYVKVGAFLEDIDLFDAAFFGFNPKEAEMTDPQHRLFLECAWEALEDAGYDSLRTESRIGVYAGASLSNYLSFNFNDDQIGSAHSFQKLLGNDKDFLATRVSYKLNLTGPSLTVQTACSTSLVATSLACQSLLNYQCDMALAGGISIRVPQKTGYLHQEGGILSPDGHCRAFDANAQGTIIGNGVGVVVLKRLSDAISDGDNIYATIRSTAINNDGAGKVGYTAPSVNGQAEAIIEALALAGVEPESISYIEAHGTGTALGDPIEISALTNAFRTSTQKNNFCAIASVKTNIGHLDAAAGIAGLIKTALALKHQLIPPSLNFSQPNPKIDFANTPFYVNTELRQWQANGTPRRAGVSSLGIGGTNAHAILEEAPVVEASSPAHPWHLLVLSAKSETALESATANLAAYLAQNPHLNLADVAYTLQIGRREFNYRRMVVCQSISDAVSALKAKEPQKVLPPTEANSITFMFPGQGSQYVNMARELYEYKQFQEEVDRCCLILKPHLGLDLRSIIYPRELEKAAIQLKQTSLAQPALFVIEYALAKLWMSWGIVPQAAIGHSIGEYVAACLAGVISIEDTLALVAWRGKLMQQMPAGAMLSVALSEAELKPLLHENLSLAASNAPNLCVVSGNFKSVDAFEEKLISLGVNCRRLHTSHAFHSQMMEPVLEPFIKQLKNIKLNSPQIPFISNLTGTWITAEQATDVNYWAQHLRHTVLFNAGILTLLQEENRIFLEVGAGRTLSTLVKQHQSLQQLVLPSLRHPQEEKSDIACLLHTLGQLWLAGVEINWSGFYSSEKRHRLPLPTYPFERQRYWIDQIQTESNKQNQKLDLNDWFYVPSWKRTISPVYLNQSSIKTKKSWLIFLDNRGVGCQVAERLKQANQEVVIVRQGEEFAKCNQQEYIINPEIRDDYDVLLKEVCSYNQPQHIVHFWSVTSNECLEWEEIQKCFWSLLFLVQALGEQKTDISIDIISNYLQYINDNDNLCPGKATILGLCKVISQEYPITCRSIDIAFDSERSPLALRFAQSHQLTDSLFAEITSPSSDSIIAYRGSQRWVQYFEKLPVKDATSNTPKLRQGGVYLITGGLGKIGLEIAQYLAKTVKAKLVLINRSGLPVKTEWQDWLSHYGEEDLISSKIQKIQILEESGAEVLVMQADVANCEQMQAVVNQTCQHFGTIHGVIHAAGVPGEGLIQLKSPETAEKVFLPKIKGTLVLDNVLQDINLDFFVLFSSITSICGGLGQVDYCAANAFLDAFAQANFYNRDKFTVAINWDTWEANNWQDSLTAFAPDIQAWFQQMRTQYGIKSWEGVKAFEKVLSWQLPQVIVAARSIQDVIAQYDRLKLSNLLEQLDKSSSRITSAQNNSKNKVAPRNSIEAKIAKLFQETLGIDKVGIHDNFFDLGGNSLIGTQLVFQLQQEFQTNISIKLLFTAPSIAELALAIEDQMIEELNQLTDEEAAAILSGI
ncbi:SDR family NAD(P)-dependent oxidoreductase [Gloeocapsopsis crepidinum LEGE 06123]|uniref:SDR family NAD(P)-dependent oxidoreductase n=1 Tax=Gloeocapsopsis crepidinum LEGE 06123 TaxID=588587 RepID=A0ABR9UPT6_9CHRO|nr:type I polyketide synthase [Gloeocapsopsis crepidinum]MBE9190287.1 SDR family NAD(P)-dependent oxidoreductase [Gloeocapsopsis crepidinum LEGE 06123]